MLVSERGTVHVSDDAGAETSDQTRTITCHLASSASQEQVSEGILVVPSGHDEWSSRRQDQDYTFEGVKASKEQEIELRTVT